ncbi:MAG TPA: methyl-accepting chemotaxis protein [Isosphaeraceae bacterium]|nr:methyl-accepting chemotaxis protein [Isosphaeraceae bacterium]
MRRRILMTGAGAGGLGAALALAAVSGLGPAPGGPLGLAAAAGAGAAGAWIAARGLGGRVIEHLILLEEVGAGRPAATLAPIDRGRLDEALAAVRHALERSGRRRAEFEEVERLAGPLMALVLDDAPAAAGPEPGARARAIGPVDAFRRTAARLVRDAGALREVNERMASGAADQSDTVDRTTTTVEALSDKIDRISQNAEEAADACVHARQEASRGLERLHSVIEGMDRLRAQVESSGRKARRLGDRSQEIGAIVELIRGISGRTDMLALNATIESVRAGEHGRGFAVVAEEIRKLAERTAAATREIGTLVEAIQADTHESIRALSEEQTQMDQELHRVREAGTALERISAVAERSARLVEGISRSSNDQVLATQDLVRAMQRISEVSHLALEGTERSRAQIEGICRCCEPFRHLAAPEAAPHAATPHGRSAVPPSKGERRLHPAPCEPTA